MKIGCKVQYIGPNEELKNKEGILLIASRGYCGIAFNEPVPEGHNLGGNCQQGYGLYVPSAYVQQIYKFKVGDMVRVIKGNAYGKAGTVVSIEDNYSDSDNPLYYVKNIVQGKETVEEWYETNLVSEENFVPAPFEIGQYVCINPEKVNLLFEDGFTSLSSIMNNLTIFRQRVKTIDRCASAGGYFKITTNWNDAALPAEAYMPVTEEFNIDLFSKIYGSCEMVDTFISYGDTDNLYAGMLKEYMTFLCAYDEKELMSKNYDELCRVRDQIRFIYGDTINDAGSWTSYVDSEEKVIFIPTLSDNTFSIVKQKREEYKHDIDESYESDDRLIGWFRYQDTYVYVYNLFQIDRLLELLLEHMPKKYGVTPITQLLAEKRYGGVVTAYQKYCKIYKNRLDQLYRISQITESLKILKNSASRRYQQNESEIRDRIRNYEENLRDLYLSLRRIQLQIIGITNDSSADMEALKSFLTGMGDRLVSFTVTSGGEMVIQLQQDWMFFDEELYKTINFRVSYEGQFRKEIYDLLDDIVSRKITLMFEETLCVKSNGSITCSQRDGSSNSKSEIRHGIPNPHHYFFNCWGDNESRITKTWIEGKYIPCLSQIISAVAGVNFADGAVMRKMLPMLETLMNSQHRHWNGNKCLRDNKTGEVFALCDYPRWKKEHMTGNQ